MPRQSYWQIYLCYLAAVSFGLAQPLFNIVTVFRREFQLDVIDVVLIVLVFQFLIPAILSIIRVILGSRAKGLDLLVYFLAAVSLLRELQQTYFQTEGLSSDVKLSIMLSAIGIAAVLVVVLYRSIQKFAPTLGALCPLFGIYFLILMFNSPWPLHAAEHSQEDLTSPHPPILFVLMDEFSLPMLFDDKEKIDSKKFPNFSALSANSMWYRQAISNYPTTAWSLPSLLQGRYILNQMDLKLLDNIEVTAPDSLFNRLQSLGYKIEVFSDDIGCSHQKFSCPKYLSGKSSVFLWRVFSKFLQEFGPDYIIDRFLPFLHGDMLKNQHNYLLEIANRMEPGKLNFVHLMTSHAPYVFQKDGSYHNSPHLRMAAGADFARTRVNYEDQLRYLDQILGQLFEEVKKSKHFKNSITVIASDHGNCWTPQCPGRVYPSQIKTIEPTLPRIPMFVIAPNLNNRVDDRDSQIVDLMPTIMDLLGAPIADTEKLDGVSLISQGRKVVRTRNFYLQAANSNTKPIELALPVRAINITVQKKAESPR